MVRGVEVNPRIETLHRIRRELGIPIASVYGDTFDAKAVNWIESYAPAVDLNIVQDCYSVYPTLAADRGKYLDSWTPQDPAIFHGGEVNGGRPIDVSFVGSVARYPDRKLAVGMLAAAGIPIYQGGGETEDPLTIDDYADVLRRSKICLNFSRPMFGEPNSQCKGRTVEVTLCGGMLLEQENPETEKWFKPGVDYVPFSDERDLVAKTRYYLAHADARLEIAAAGHAKASQTYSAGQYWQMVLQRIGVV